MDDLKLVVEDDGTHKRKGTLPVVGTRKMTSETVIGSMGGDTSSENNHDQSVLRQPQPYDGGSLSTHDENDMNISSSASNNRVARRVTALSSSCQNLFGKVTGTVTNRLPLFHRGDGNRNATDNNDGMMTNDRSAAETKTTTTKKLSRFHQLVPSTAFRALMRRNVIYRKRNWLSTIFELVLPSLFLILLALVKRSHDKSVSLGVKIPDGGLLKPGDSFIPQPQHTYQPMTFADTVTVLQAKKVCKWVVDTNVTDENGDDSHFEITGIDDRSRNWQIPYVRCNSNLCTDVGQDATDFCEFSMLAIASSNPEGLERAIKFNDWIYQRYPGLNTNNRTQIVRVFDYQEEVESQKKYSKYSKGVDAYIQSPEYGVTTTKISLAVVFNGSDPNSYIYAIRQNSTNFNVPEEQDSLKPGTKTTPKSFFNHADYTSSDLETCAVLTGTDSLNSADLGVLGTSCTGQYMYNGVLAAQRLLHDFILYDTGSVEAGYGVAEAGVQFVQFPQVEYEPTGFFLGNVATPLLCGLGLLYSVATMISYIVQEKELRQKELMKMMSVSEFDIELSWFITFMMVNVLASCLCTYFSTNLFEHSDPFMILSFWLLSFSSLTFYSTALAAGSCKTIRTVLVGLLFFFGGLFMNMIFPIAFASDVVLKIVMLHPMAVFAYSIEILGVLEDLNLGLTSESMHLVKKGNFAFRDMFMAYLYSCIFWCAITWYMNRSTTPDYGQAPEVWYFPFTWSYWKSFVQRRTQLIVDTDSSAIDVQDEDDDEATPIEPVSEILQKQSLLGDSIEIKNLRKDFGEKLAVNRLNLSMYSGQITALLGHNGAGKTTTINMITGAIAPTSGTATVAGKDIRTHMPEIRRDIGICLQHDCLFPRLTVREHVEFFARLKGFYDDLSKAEADKHVDQAIEDVALWEKRHTHSSNLSGGMKRKLSVAIAFCGGSKVVVLDEPTSGMDPFSRRFTWNVIRHYRQNRVIILTTHFMDEADILGDRIAIMSDGKLRCAGSSLYLKKIFGSGYQLTIEKSHAIGLRSLGGVEPSITHCENATPIQIDDVGSVELVEEDGHEQIRSQIDAVSNRPSTTTSSYGCTQELKQIVTSFISEAKLLSDVGSELSYQLPMGSSHQFSAMFQQLDDQIEKGSISCYGVSITTLDEVFMLVTRGAELEKATFASSHGGTAHVVSPNDSSQAATITLDDKVSFSRHLCALLKKRAAIFRRDKKAWLFTTILPSLFVLFGFLLFTTVSFNQFWQPRTLRISDVNKDHADAPVQNPFPVNSPDTPFMCQTPTCSHRLPLVQENLTDEVYFFCGFQSKLGISLDGYIPANLTCNISESTNIIDTLTYSGIKTAETSVANIIEASESLIETSRQLGTNQFGAIWFTHEYGSVMDDGRSYADAVVSQCEYVSARVNYSRVEDCRHHAGLGFIIQYNFTLLHVAPMYQAIADEAIVRHATNNPNFIIEATIAPLAFTLREEKSGKADDAFTAWFLVVLSFPFISGAFATFVVNERYSKAKHVQSIAGVEPAAYWLSTFIWDIANFLIPLGITVALMFAFSVEVLTTSKRDIFPAVLTIMALYGPASAGFTYCVSFAFQSATLCNVAVIISGFFVGMGGTLTCHVLLLRSVDPRGPDPQLGRVADVLGWFLRWNPSFCLGSGIFNSIYIDSVALVRKIDDPDAWHPLIAKTEIICLAIHSVVYIILAIVIDKWSTNPHALALWQNCKDISWVWRMGKPLPPVVIPQCLDDDVLAEQELVHSGKSCNDSIVIRNLTKIYGNGKVAVNNLSLGVSPGECFGLLGINGAGKTTAMGMLTAEFPPTSGDAILGGYSITREPQKIRRRIGYCPQFCAHFENMTGREHLEMYAAIKGITKSVVSDAVSKKLKEVGLSDYDGDRLSSNYSGGMKRRLSLACATIGQPEIVFLDECSTGVDPLTRRDIWQLVSDMVVGNSSLSGQKPAVILTTHSMEECEALCPRIGIMANGQLRCLGSAQHLKSKFGKGYQLEVKVQHVSRSDVDFQQNISEIVDRYNVDSLTVSLPDTSSSDDPEVNVSVPDLYFNVEEAKLALEMLSGDDYLPNMVESTDPNGYSIWKEASGTVTGVHLSTLVLFATCELRMRQLDRFINQSFPKNVLRERQETKARYEVDCDGMKISSIFARIEENKDQLRLSDYCVSQTSLEQVFNTHAAEAEQNKLHQIDG